MSSIKDEALHTNESELRALLIVNEQTALRVFTLPFYAFSCTMRNSQFQFVSFFVFLLFIYGFSFYERSKKVDARILVPWVQCQFEEMFLHIFSTKIMAFAIA